MGKIKYINSAGVECPSVTTILGLINKPALVYAAWKLGTEGKDYRKEWERKGDVGTLTHKYICNYFQNKDEISDPEFFREGINESEYTGNVIEKALRCFTIVKQWSEDINLKPVISETPFVSDSLKVGGTPDLLAMGDNIETVIDFKTGKDFTIYPENKLQIFVYKHIFEEHGYNIKKCWIVKINTEQREMVKYDLDMNLYKPALKIFKGLLSVYNNIKRFDKNG